MAGEKKLVERSTYDVIDIINNVMKQHNQKMKELQEYVDGMFEKNKGFVNVKTDSIDDFQKSIDEFQKANPNAKIKASAYTYSSGEQPKLFTYKLTRLLWFPFA